jgi:hypothetical protein
VKQIFEERQQLCKKGPLSHKWALDADQSRKRTLSYIFPHNGQKNHRKGSGYLINLDEPWRRYELI